MSNDSFAFLQKDLAPNELNAQINLHLVPILKRHQRQSGNITPRYEVDNELKCTVVTNNGEGPGNTDSDTAPILPSITPASPGGESVPSIGMVGALVSMAFWRWLDRSKWRVRQALSCPTLRDACEHGPTTQTGSTPFVRSV